MTHGEREMLKHQTHPWVHPDAPSGITRIAYTSMTDCLEDWALVRRPREGRTWVVHLHGHGSTGDQVYTRPDIRQHWLAHYLALGLGILSPNLRGNAWMSPEAVADLHALLEFVRGEYGAQDFCFLSGSMGATGNLSYATIHPEDVSMVAALCPVTDLSAYHEWCCLHPGGVRDEIRAAIESAYGGRPDQVPEQYVRRNVARHADRLTMPLLLAHATGDGIVPVEQSRVLWQRLSGRPQVTYVEIEGGDHDSPLHGGGLLGWLDGQLQRLRRRE